MAKSGVEHLAQHPGWKTKSKGNQRQFLNHYRCPGDLEYRKQHEPLEWSDTWSCMCNDKCPECNAEIEPYESEDA